MRNEFLKIVSGHFRDLKRNSNSSAHFNTNKNPETLKRVFTNYYLSSYMKN